VAVAVAVAVAVVAGADLCRLEGGS
jgi:hypothetical protein